MKKDIDRKISIRRAISQGRYSAARKQMRKYGYSLEDVRLPAEYIVHPLCTLGGPPLPSRDLPQRKRPPIKVMPAPEALMPDLSLPPPPPPRPPQPRPAPPPPPPPVKSPWPSEVRGATVYRRPPNPTLMLCELPEPDNRLVVVFKQGRQYQLGAVIDRIRLVEMVGDEPRYEVVRG